MNDKENIETIKSAKKIIRPLNPEDFSSQNVASYNSSEKDVETIGDSISKLNSSISKQDIASSGPAQQMPQELNDNMGTILDKPMEFSNVSFDYNVVKTKKRISVKVLVICGLLFATVLILIFGLGLFKDNNNPENLGDTNKWIIYNTDDWKASFPYKPEVVKKNISNGATLLTYRTKSSDNINLYEVSVEEKSKNNVSSQENLNKALEGWNSESSSRKSIKILNQKYVSLNSKLAVDITQSYDLNGEILISKARIISDGNKLYYVQTLGLEKEAINADYFINNFKLL